MILASPRYKKYTEETILKIVNLYLKGFLIKEIKIIINLNEDLIGKIIRENLDPILLKQIRSKNANRK